MRLGDPASRRSEGQYAQQLPPALRLLPLRQKQRHIGVVGAQTARWTAYKRRPPDRCHRWLAALRRARAVGDGAKGRRPALSAPLRRGKDDLDRYYGCRRKCRVDGRVNVIPTLMCGRDGPCIGGADDTTRPDTEWTTVPGKYVRNRSRRNAAATLCSGSPRSWVNIGFFPLGASAD